MSRVKSTTIFLLFLLSVSSLRASAIDGDWFGTFEHPGAKVFVLTHFVSTNNKTTGTIDFTTPAKLIKGKPLSNLECSSSHLHFVVSDKDKTRFTFDGQVTNGVITGFVEEGSKKFPMRLDWFAKADCSRYAGIYRVGPGRFIRLAPTMFSSLLLASFDFQSAKINLLLPHSDSDFICGPDLKTYPLQARIHLTTNQSGQCTTMQWKPENGPELVGTPIKESAEEVSFTNNDVKLAGTLVLPPTKGPHPAIVITHGSGPGFRNSLRFLADFFAMNGIAALTYDKRGCGASTGDWKKSGFDDLGGDALAGLEMLRHRSDIDSQQIGLWGMSQGGWLVGLCASRSTNVAFIIGVSGPGITPEAQGAFTVESRMKTSGFAEADIRDALSLYEWNSRCARSDSGWDEFEAACKAVKAKRWYNDDIHPYNRGENEIKQWQLIWNYDPVPVLQKVQCPVLSIFGEIDPLVPAQRSADIWKSALETAGNKNVTIKIFPHADHGINDAQAGTQPAEYFTLQRDWLAQHLTIRSDQ
jgi:alpha-beta hydrolase superfamily lysophospholipase